MKSIICLLLYIVVYDHDRKEEYGLGIFAAEC